LEHSFRALFYCCTFELLKLPEADRVTPFIWKLAEHKLQYIHMHYAFVYFACCFRFLAEKKECPCPEGFLTALDDFYAKMEPGTLSAGEMKDQFVDFIVEKGCTQCTCFIMEGIDKDTAVRERANSLALRGVVSGVFLGGPPSLEKSVLKGYGAYVRTLQIIWQIHSATFCRLARRALGLME